MTYVTIVGYFLLGLVIGFGGGYCAFHVATDPQDDDSATPASYYTR